ncbi:MAG: S1 RNA-binding domain-containing protein [Clostridia bacterium]
MARKSARRRQYCEGTVVRFADFGAFVELEKGVDALIHISHLSRKLCHSPRMC